MSPTQSRWAAQGIRKGLARTFQEPGDLLLAARIGVFLWRIPRQLDRKPLDSVLGELSREPRDESGDLEASATRISRIRQAWLMSPLLRERNTCYIRALTLYRFLNAGSRSVRIHFGVEPGVREEDRIRGHAWVTVNGDVLEAPEPLLTGRVRELYSFPVQ